MIEINSHKLLIKAFINAAKSMGLSSSEMSNVINRDVSQLSEINPESNEGIRALYFIRIYKKLYGLASGDEDEMKLWMKGENIGTRGIPKKQIQEKDITSLMCVMEYLEAIP